MFSKFWKFVTLVLIRKFQIFLLRIYKKLRHGTIRYGKNVLSEASCYSELHYVWITLCRMFTIDFNILSRHKSLINFFIYRVLNGRSKQSPKSFW